MSVKATMAEVEKVLADMKLPYSTVGVMRSPAQWQELLSAVRRMRAALRKVKRVSHEFDEARDIAHKALKRSGLL